MESANTVGYVTKSITQDTYYMVGVQLEKVGADAVAGLNDIVKMSGITAVPYDDQETDGAAILVSTPSGYDFYYYINDAYDSNNNVVTGWAKDGDLVETADLALGDGFWFITKNATAGATLTVAGEVTAASEIAVTFGGNKEYFIRSNPFPTGVTLGSVTTTGVTAVPYDDQETDGAAILVSTPSGYDFYYYINDAYDSNNNTVTGWAKDGDLVENETIAAGESFWICSPNAGSLTFSL